MGVVKVKKNRRMQPNCDHPTAVILQGYEQYEQEKKRDGIPIMA